MQCSRVSRFCGMELPFPLLDHLGAVSREKLWSLSCGPISKRGKLELILSSFFGKTLTRSSNILILITHNVVNGLRGDTKA